MHVHASSETDGLVRMHTCTGENVHAVLRLLVRACRGRAIISADTWLKQAVRHGVGPKNSSALSSADVTAPPRTCAGVLHALSAPTSSFGTISTRDSHGTDHPAIIRRIWRGGRGCCARHGR